ncbi:MAG: DNA polymerase III subunit alpha [Pirellulaceae bacterium]
MSGSFVHLHCHSHYSLLDGASSIGKLIDRAKSHGMNALALTDHGNLHGALEFYKKAKTAGINPIIGYEAYVAPESRFTRGNASSSKEAAYHLTLLAKNRVGFKNLIKLASKASLEGFYFKPRIDRELLAELSEGIICLSGCVSSEFSRAVLNNQDTEKSEKEAIEIAQWFHGVFGERYFIEVMNNNLEIQRSQLEGAVRIANKIGLPIVATSDAHYADREDAEIQDVLLCINTGKFRTDTARMKMEGNQFYLRSPEEMYASFPGLEDAVARSQEIANTVEIDLELGKRHFPVYPLPPEKKDPDDYLREVCVAGLKDRYAGNEEMLPGGELSEVAQARLDRELGVIQRLGFANYFLIVWDFVRHSRERGVPNTARGSGVGALVCYATYLSHVCPIKYDLLFERFLDENRLEAPDIDIDFCKDRRAEIIQYVRDKYGEENVAQIGTFGTMAAKAAIKDVGRALGIPLMRVNQITEMVPDELKITIKKAIDKNIELKATYEGDSEARELLDIAMKLEGNARNVGTHAAAVVIADKPLTEYVPLGRVSGKTDIITQWSMGDVEEAGLLKMDFLGLRNLTILSKAVQIIHQTTGEDLDLLKIPLDDKRTFALLQRGETKGVFQLESGGIRDLLQRMKPDHFSDIIATNALYRPGPLEGGMVDDYVAVKHKRKEAVYLHEVLKDILEETNGVMVYQEQVMRILNRLGGIELAAAYTCIKAISKKKEALIAQNESKFMEGATDKGLTEKQAREMWEMILKFAGYGFNKCVVGNTLVTHAETGEQTTVGELFRNRRDWTIHALGNDWQLRPREVSDVVWNGRKRVYRVRTQRGAEIVATANHPLRTVDGWTLIENLAIGDRVAAARELRCAGDVSWPQYRLIVLAGLLAEGNTCHPSCLYYYNNDRSSVDDFVTAVSEFDDTVARVTTRRGNCFEVCVGTGRDAKFTKGNVPWNARPNDALDSATVAVKDRQTTPKRSGAFHWAEQLGLLGKSAAEKSIPAEVFRLIDDDVILFVGRLWSGDGFMGASGQMPYYATSSMQFAKDVQQLLLRLGVVSRIHNKVFRYRYGGQSRQREGFTVHLLGKESVARFVEKIAPHAIGRESQVAAFEEYLATVSTTATSKDTIPASIRQTVNVARVAKGLGWRQLESQSGMSMKEFYGQGSVGKVGFRRSTIGRLGAFLKEPALEELAESDVYWDTIVSIEPAGIQDTYDLEVEEDHNFVAGSLIVHNSHSTAYALLAYQTAYLKAHYPVEFMAALLSGDIPGRNFKRKDSLIEHIEDCTRMGIEVVHPNVNSSDVDFTVKDKKIYFALSAIKGCGGGAAEAISAERKKNGPFKSIFEFCERVEASGCNRAAIETLIKAGAFDETGAKRSQLMAVVEKAIQAGASMHADRRSGQMNLFGEEIATPEEELPTNNMPEMDEFADKPKLMMEKEVLGMYLSAHPLEEYQALLATFCSHETTNLKDVKDRQEVIVGGMISSIKLANTKNPKPGASSKYANFDLEDVQGAVRCICWPDGYEKIGHLIQPEAVVIMRATVDKRGGSDDVNLLANEIIPIGEAETRFTAGLRIHVDQERHAEELLGRLNEVLRGYPGNMEVLVALRLNTGDVVQMKSRRHKVEITPELRGRLDDLLGSDSHRLMISPPKPKQHSGGGRKGK